jgi:hypothetical protein
MRAPLALGLPLLLLLADVRSQPPTVVVPPRPPLAAPGVTFADATRGAGLASFHRVSGSASKDYLLEAKGGGLALLDFDGDGWLDVYLVNGATFEALRGQEEAPPAALFRNNRDGTFTDVTALAGVPNRGWGQGACTGDYDNDGDEDLYVTNFGPNRLYRNDGQGRFTEAAGAAGVALGGWSTGCAFGDYDADGRLDLFVAGNIVVDLERLPPAPPHAAARPGPTGPAAPAETTSGSMQAPYRPGMAYCAYRGVPAMCGPKGLRGAPDHLFHNDGNGRFTEVSAKAGVADPNGYYGLGVAFFDFDDDGRIDLFVANDSCPNYLYRNRGDGTFQDVSFASGAAFNEAGQEQAHMGVAVGDYDRDGRDDLHVTNFENDANILYHNEGGGLFSEATYPAGVGTASVPFVGWGTSFMDYDNDGWLDLFVANGHVYPFVDGFDWNTSYEERALLFRNINGKFVEVGRAGDGLAALRSMRGSATGDLDNDGDIDFVVNSIDGEPLVLRNDGGNRAGHWLRLHLVGDPKQRGPRDATGSVVFLTAGGARQRGEVASGRSLMSQLDRRVHFGLGPATRVDRLEVRWANGPTVAYEVPSIDTEIVIDQARGTLFPAPKVP